MHLKAIQLHGFKSFADGIQLHFEPGVTAVVGPNGCGKSNIADAIRWVLGEQSAKALRGGKMQDVIFEGTDSRKPAQLSEVSLLLSECEAQLGSEFHEVEIMRRVHRDGQSEYFFNGRACRLKDIHKLFMDTGIGRTSYSIMAQGQIDQILSSRPEERRAVFEEAAGITKYKSHRREAMNKLALTEQNLARAADVIAEVGRQIGSLRRQAAKAIRYRRLSHRMRSLSLAWTCHQHQDLNVTTGELAGKVESLQRAAEGRRAAVETADQSLDDRNAQRSRLNQRIQEAQRSVYELRSQRDAAENAAGVASIRRSGLEERIQASRESLGELEMQLREVSAQADTGAQDKQLQLGLLGSSDSIFQQRSRDLALADGELHRVEEQLQQAKFRLLQAESAVARLRTDCSGYEVEQKTSAHRHDLVAADLAQVLETRRSAEEAVAALEERSRTAAEARSAADGEASAAQDSLSELTRRFREEQRELLEIDRQLAQRGARLKLLQQLQERWEGFGEGAKAILQGRLHDPLEPAPAVPVTQGLQVRSGWGRAIEVLLGSAAEALNVPDFAVALKLLARLEAEQLGTAVLRVDEVRGAAEPEAGLPPGLLAATAALEGDATNQPVATLLAGCYVAENLSEFLAYWKEHPDFQFLAVATRNGERIDGRGLISGGRGKEGGQGAGIVQREIDIRETTQALAAEQVRHAERKAAIDGLSAELNGAEVRLEERRIQVLQATQAGAAVDAELRNARRTREEILERVRRLEAESSALEQARAEAHSRWETARGKLEEADASLTGQRDEIARLEQALEASRGDRDAKRESLAQARLELAERRQKVEILDRGLGEMAQRRLQLSDLLLQRQQEIETWTEQAAALENEAVAERDRVAGLADTTAVAQQQVERLREELGGVEADMARLEQAQNAARTEMDAAQEELSSERVRLAELRQRMTFLEEDARREFQAELSEVDWRLLLWRAEDEPEGLRALDLDEDDSGEGSPSTGRRRKVRIPRAEPAPEDLAKLDATDWEAVRIEVEALRQRLGGMGAVNLVAIEEYADLKQRHDFLLGQSNDLTAARTELLQVIDEINRTSLRQFEVTFEQIRKNFAYTFQTLFGGGRAALDLIATDDVLESGIEIVAQPPGTRLKSISLLSGGQKTLTAVALLFALYMVKPSPFCLLDELDAPLDESNIGRFTDLLRKFVADSQFIIITHNKRTVAAADAIYGVTMEERGVSKVVSMRFNHERGEAEAHADSVLETAANVAPTGIEV